RKVASISPGDGAGPSSSRPVEGIKPNQVSRTGHRDTSAARLNRSSTRRAQTTPQVSRNQNQIRSQDDDAGGVRRAFRRASQRLMAKSQPTHDQIDARRPAAHPRGDSARYSTMKRAARAVAASPYRVGR